MSSPLRVLILEDSPPDAELMVRALKQSGYEEITWSRAESERGFQEALSPPPDVVLADYTLPSYDASRALTFLKNARLDVPFIVVTGSISEEAAVECIRAGAADYLLKGRLARLGPAVQRALRDKRLRQEKRRAEFALLESEERFKAAVQHSTDIITILNAEGVILYQSPAGERILGYEAGEIVGSNAFEYVHPEDRDETFRVFVDGLAAGQGVSRATYRFRSATGEWVHLESVASAMQADLLSGYVINSRDITERVRLQEQLRHSQKMDAMGRLAGGVAHDFNNLLMAIGGYTQMILADLTPNAPHFQELTQINLATEKAANLVRQLLLFSRRESGSARRINPNEVIAEMSRLIGRVIGEAISVETQLEEGLPTVEVDTGSFEQILMNLAVNARDAMDGEGRLTISTGVTEVAGEQARDGAPVAPGAYVRITMRDTGCGMDADTAERIFEPFFTTKPAGAGTGLGLSTVYGVIQQCGGFVDVETAPGGGTAFHICFPAGERPAAPAETPPAAKEKERVHIPMGQGETLLLVEDDDQLRKLVSAALDNMGYSVLAAGKPSEAVDVFRKNRDTIDLLVTDIIMPETPGNVLYEKLRGEAPGLRAVFLSGYTGDTLPGSDGTDIAVPVLQKPFRFHELGQTIRDVLDD